MKTSKQQISLFTGGGVDILTGGFPCQPYSLAGLRKGKEDERHLWPEMLRAIREIKPRWIVGENVLGLVGWNDGMVFEEVQADLEAEGYEVQPYVLPACAKDAPHRRDRVWFIAYASNHNGGRSQSVGNEAGQFIFSESSRFGEEWTVADSNSNDGCMLSRYEACHGRKGTSNCINSDFSRNEDVTHSTSKGLQKSGQTGVKELSKESRQGLDNRFELICSSSSNPDGIRLRREGNGVGKSRLFGQNGSFDYWDNFPTQSPVCNGDDGLSSRLDAAALLNGRKPRQPWQSFGKWRTESIKAGGNAIVPQVIHQIFKAIQEYEDQIIDKKSF